ncbi:MAG: rhodanese-like domain-containing protein [Negativicutes bacterium]|nr:rhodanese-like domain-containing protein [Negativicutes bacterium]
MLLPKARKIAACGLLLCITVIIAACGSQTASDKPVKTPPPAPIANPFAVLQTEADKYIKQNRPLYVLPQEVYEKCIIAGNQDYVLVDIRNDEHYAAAHIPGAIHIAYADAWREAKIAHLPKDKKIIVIDYSGHTASQVAAFWGMLGYDALPLKNGMSGWTKDRDIIGGSPLICEAYNYPVSTAAAAPGSYQPPKLETKAVAVAELLMERSREATETAPVLQPKDLKEKPGSWYVVDIRDPVHYQAGHIEGAVNIPFRTIAETDSLKKIPADKPVVLVCYDGHAASQAARILNQLGYHATALKDGMSAWSANEMVIGAKTVACNITEHPVMKLNALLKPGPSTAAT